MTLLILGGIFLLGLVADVAGRLTPLPRVTLLLLSGVAIGPTGLALVPDDFIEVWFPTLTQIALAMVGFLMGQRLSLRALKDRGSVVVTLALGKVLGAALLVGGVLMLLGVDPVLALVLAGVATATDPVATFDVVHEERARGRFAETLLSVVAIDDAWALILFSLLLAVAVALGGDQSAVGVLTSGVMEVLGSLALGAVLGVPMAYLTGRLNFGYRPGEPIQAESFGFVLACAGGATVLELSPILAAMTMGAVVASLATHHRRPFHAIQGVEWPFMILFFVLSGTSLDMDGVDAMALTVAVYLVARALGTWLGVYGAARGVSAEADVRNWMGLALLPQAGVALGTALIASQRLPGQSETILTVVLATTIVLELGSPPVTRRVLRWVGAAGSGRR
ncbi:MAG: cation:proton antiporter [Pseudomonadota bacterium]